MDGAFEDHLYINIEEDSSKFFTEARNIRDRNLIFFFTSRPVSGFIMGVEGFYSSSLIIQLGQLF